MKNITLLILVVGFLLIGCKNDNSNDGNASSLTSYSYPPEWTAQEAVWVDFCTEQAVVPNIYIKLDLIRNLAHFVQTKVVYDDEILKKSALEYLIEQSVDTTQIDFVKVSQPVNWIRDAGPMFLTNGEDLKMINFNWTCYGLPDNCNADRQRQVVSEIATKYELNLDSIRLNLEGGGIEVSSNSILANKSMLTQRNPNISLQEIENLLLKTFGKEQIIWLEGYPLLDKIGNKIANHFGNGSNGNIDFSTRFLNDTAILTTVISDADKMNTPLQEADYKIYQSHIEQLKTAKRPDGKPYHIITLEAPDYSKFLYTRTMSETYYNIVSAYEDIDVMVGDTVYYPPVMSFTNYILTNGAIIIPNYWSEGYPPSEKIKSDKFISIIKAYYPDRQIIPINVLAMNWGGGGLHGRVLQQPKLN